TSTGLRRSGGGRQTACASRGSASRSFRPSRRRCGTLGGGREGRWGRGSPRAGSAGGAGGGVSGSDIPVLLPRLLEIDVESAGAHERGDAGPVELVAHVVGHVR